MERREIICTRLGEMLDMINCLSIYNGAEPKETRRALRYEEAVKLR